MPATPTRRAPAERGPRLFPSARRSSAASGRRNAAALQARPHPAIGTPVSPVDRRGERPAPDRLAIEVAGETAEGAAPRAHEHELRPQKERPEARQRSEHAKLREAARRNGRRGIRRCRRAFLRLRPCGSLPFFLATRRFCHARDSSLSRFLFPRAAPLCESRGQAFFYSFVYDPGTRAQGDSSRGLQPFRAKRGSRKCSLSTAVS